MSIFNFKDHPSIYRGVNTDYKLIEQFTPLMISTGSEVNPLKAHGVHKS